MSDTYRKTSGFFRKVTGRRASMPWLLGVAVGSVGCTETGAPPSIQTRVAKGTSRSEGGRAASERSGDSIALVNGAAIDEGAFLKSLVESHGLALLQRWAMREAARQEADRVGAVVTKDDIQAETNRQLEAGWGEGSVRKMTDHQRDDLIEAYLRLRGLSRFELDLVMERDACLRKIAERQMEPTEKQLHDEYRRQYGERVQVRYIQFPAPRFWESIQKELERGADFGELARRHSIHEASRDSGGLLPEFSRDDPFLPRAFIDVAFALQPGQVSNPLNYEGACHVMKLENRVPARDVPLENVREEVRQGLRDRLIREEMQRLTESLWLKSRFQIEDPVLRAEYRRQVHKGELKGPALVDGGD